MSQATYIDCDLLTGFLGSGKTTLLNAWLRSSRSAGTAVVVNEIGNIGIDQLIFSRVTDNVVLLESGCLCCTLNGTLRETLLDLCAAARANGTVLTRIVIETTGLAEPLPILHTLLGDKILAETEAIRLNQVIVTIDGQQGMWQLTSQPECMRQLAVAECVVITKSDITPHEDLDRLRHEVCRINPTAELIESFMGDAAARAFTATSGDMQRQTVLAVMVAANHLPAEREHGLSHHHDHPTGHAHDIFHSRVRTLGFYITDPITWPGITAWWHLVVNHYGEKLLRCKGLLRVQDSVRPHIFIQTVGKVFHPPDISCKWPDSDLRSRLVCIGVNLDTAWLQQSLVALRIRESGFLPVTLTDLSYMNLPYLEQNSAQ